MKLLPIVERELRAAARRRGTYWIRFSTAAISMGAAAMILLGMLDERPTEQSRILFFCLSVVAFGYCLGAGLLTADCISEEKREGTLGLLFLTNLRGWDVVLGKMAAGSLLAASGLLAVLPVMAVPLLMGAVAPSMVGQVTLVLLNTLFLALSVGVLVSVLSRDARQAVGATVLVLVFLVALVPVFRWMFIDYILKDALGWYQPAPGRSEPMEWLHALNPAVLLGWAVSTLFGGMLPGWGNQWFDYGLAAQHGMAWLALGSACFLAPRCWRDRERERERERGPGRGRGAGEGAEVDGAGEGVEAERARPGSAVPESAPFAWIVTRERRPIWHTWAGLGVMAGVWLWGWAENREDWIQPVVPLVVLFVAGGWLKARLAGVACRHLHEHRRSGALELVLCTAQTPASLVAGCLAGMRRVIRWPLAVAVGASGVLMWAGLRQEIGAGDLEEVLLTYLAMLGVLLLDLWTLAWAGMWSGLKSGRYLRALGVTLAQVLVLPWVLFVGGLVGMGILVELFDLGGGFDPGYRTIVLGWAMVCAAVDGVLLWFAWRGLGGRFRELAVQPLGRSG